jgi:hypothetical protein
MRATTSLIRKNVEPHTAVIARRPTVASVVVVWRFGIGG